jgi:hypothetical protein
MSRKIDQIRASKLPSNMMQFAARGALQVPPAENIEILVYLARHNQVFGDIARMTLAGWDEKASVAAASDPQTAREVLEYMISPDNLRPKLLPALLENHSVSEQELVKFAVAASQESIQTMLRSARVRASNAILDALKANPYLKKEESDEVGRLTSTAEAKLAEVAEPITGEGDGAAESVTETLGNPDGDVPDETVSAYLAEHAGDVAAEEGKPFQAIGGSIELPGQDQFPAPSLPAEKNNPEPVTLEAGSAPSSASTANAPRPNAPVAGKKPQAAAAPRRENALQKINHLDVKGRIQLALKGNKEERSLLIRDGTKVVALAVLEAPKLSDGEVEKFASQKNVLEAVLRGIPLKRRFMKNYIVVRNLVANPRTPLDLGLGLMKNLLLQDLKNISANKEVSETIRKLALKMYKQKLDTANKK